MKFPIGAAGGVLAIGVLVYLVDRSPGSAYLIPDAWHLFEETPHFFGTLGEHLPSFAHAYAFILLTAALLAPWRFALHAACVFWLAADSLFEIAQFDIFAAVVARHLPAWFQSWPLLENVASYFLVGTFDPWDIASIALGGGAACVSVWYWHSRLTWHPVALMPVMALGVASIIGSGGVSIQGPFELRPADPSPPIPRPVVDAGPDQLVLENWTVTLNGVVIEPGSGIVSVFWEQRSGPTVTLDNPHASRTTFIAPPVAVRTELRFRYRARDSRGQEGLDVVTITVDPDPAGQPAAGLIQFEMQPAGTLTTEFEEVRDDYAELCLVFRNFERNDGSRGPEFRRFVYSNTAVWDNDRIFNPPPGTNFNITADFLAPVSRIEADVTVAIGETVTMTAFDSSGVMLRAVTSIASTACCAEPTDTLALHGIGDITTVLWETSSPRALAPIVDNLRFTLVPSHTPYCSAPVPAPYTPSSSG